MSVFMVILISGCLAALVPLGILIYLGNARLVLTPLAVFFGALLVAATGALLGLPLDVLFETGPLFTAGGAVAGGIVGGVAGAVGSLQQRL